MIMYKGIMEQVSYFLLKIGNIYIEMCKRKRMVKYITDEFFSGFSACGTSGMFI